MDLRVARPHALVALVAFAALALAVPTASADVIDLPDTRAELTLDPRTWRAAPTPALVYAATTERGDLLAITRAPIPNIDAWRKKTRDAYVDKIESGLATAGYKPTSKKLTTIEGVPVLDLEASPATRGRANRDEPKGSRRGPIVMRVILFRTYALSLAIEARTSRSAARAIAKTFVPPPARPEGSP
jgi:hypothetical protein